MPYYGFRWPKYVSVAERHHKSRRKMDQLRKKGIEIQPVEIEGRKIAKTFWGEAWCDHMESLGDYENRLPRGRTYVRNGSVCHLEIKKGCISAMVNGSSLYKINVKIDTLSKAKWSRVKRRCAGQIGSLIELLQGKLSDQVMEHVTDPKDGLFPAPSEIHLGCNCPDWAYLCKHLAAVLYGVGARLDRQPELIFLLRGVKHEELINTHVDQAVAGATDRGGRRRTVASSDLTDVFGIEIETTSEGEGSPQTKRKGTRRKSIAKKKTEPNRKSKPRKKKTVRSVKKKATPKKTAVKKTTPKKTTPKKTTKKKKNPAKTTKKKTTTTKKKTVRRPLKKRPSKARS